MKTVCIHHLAGGFFMEPFQKWDSLFDYVKANWKHLSEKERTAHVESLEQGRERLLSKWAEMDEKLALLEKDMDDFFQQMKTFRYESKGTSFFDLGMFEEAVKQFKQESKQSANEIIFLYLAFSQLYAEHWTGAKETFLFLLHSHEESIVHFAYVGLGCLAVQEEQWDEAIAHFEKALTLTNNVDVVYNLGMCHYLQSQPTMALAFFEDVIKAMPDDGETYYYIGRCYIANDDVEKAFNAWLTALQVVETKEILFTLAYDFEWIGMHHGAIHCYERLLSLGYDDTAVWHGLAWNIGLMDEREKAKELFTTLLEQSDDVNVLTSYLWLLRTWGEKEELQRIANATNHILSNYPLCQASLLN